MGIEIERKFLVDSSRFVRPQGERLAQGYLSGSGGSGKATVRVRVGQDACWLTIKGRTRGLSRSEFEYEIPREDAHELLQLCSESIVDKIRYRVPFEGKAWEVDEFLGANAGLWVAELELEREDEHFTAPPWLGPEVSGDHRYSNSYLAKYPFEIWEK